MSAVFRPSVKICYNNLCIRFGTRKVRRLNQRRSKGEISGGEALRDDPNNGCEGD